MSRIVLLATAITVLLPQVAQSQGGRRPARPARQPAASTAVAPQLDTATYSQLRYRYIGPVGNRVSAVAGVVGDASTYYAGAASGGVGKTWQHLGLDLTGRIARVVIHPTNPDIVYAAALGHSYGPQQERGVYRTTDGGKTWERVLFVDPNTGASDIAMDPNNPRILFAGMWQLEIHTWGRERDRKSTRLNSSHI